MKIAILGGGFTGLSAAFYLRQKGHEVTIFEKEKNLGGLAGGFTSPGWDWRLERTYHHLFETDSSILGFARDIGFDGIFFRSPLTASLYKISDFGSQMSDDQRSEIYRIIPVDTPQDFLKFPLLAVHEKIRAAAVLAFLKLSPFLPLFEHLSAEEFMSRYQGRRVWEVFWQELFRKKFGKYAGNIVASFIWARIHARSKKLGYVRGGFQEFIDFAAKKNEELGVEIKRGVGIDQIKKRGEKFVLSCNPERSEGSRTKSGSKAASLDSSALPQNDNLYDAVISTLPTPVLVKVGESLFPKEYIDRLKKIKYLHAINLILETNEKILDKTYWLSICTPDMPMMVVVQHTNFQDATHYTDKHISYIGNYIEGDDPRLKMTDKEVLDFYLPHLEKISKVEGLRSKISNHFVFKAPWAQPIFDKEFVRVKPDFETPVKNFFIANLDMTYPYDRGTNFAVKLGMEVAKGL